MHSKSWKLFSLGLLVAAAAGGWELVAGHRQNAQLRAQAAALRQGNVPVVRLATENQHTRDLVARAEHDTATASRVLHEEVVRLRAEIETLEGRAQAAVAKKAAAAERIAANRDPDKGLTKLEYFQNVGRATPTAAVQTLIWAALKGDDPALIGSIVMMDDAREKAAELLAHLPAAAREKFPAPENLAAIAAADFILRVDTAQIVNSSPLDSTHALVFIRTAGSDDEEKVLTQLTPDGWRTVVPKKLISGLERQPKPPPPAVAPKT